ncbi:lasso peptide biosynthesis B2 protein [Sphingosinicella rhizophila]|uniref:Lasso peptide biosynthesis B2 protein n=1 Tax=Sphingosinicella rhizophila TaxID=3050082 RepID=A0ABU3Q901_9SPHN|nr:lasso peptide biosynthesis B2 protein [Sphingosinicella sp. GR2756]MDT9599876.1 lasso peptide biosynthesis B2 protein [Sphingosinicella sp. GR2756]
MAHLRLHPNVSYGLIAGRPVFLDVSRDRYLGLDPVAEAAFDRARQPPSADSCTNEDTRRLLATKLFTLADEWTPMPPVQVRVPDKEISPEAASRLPFLDVSEIWVLLWHARRALVSGALGSALARLKRHRSKVVAPVSSAETLALASRFQVARALVPIARSCLQDSIALGTWLARRGACPDIVFGVKLDPFAAHCWVQTESAILNDAPDTVSPFAPVLVIS